MLKKLCLFVVLLFIVSSGCSYQPTAPERGNLNLDSPEYTFQKAVYLVFPDIGEPALIPVDIPVGELIPREQIPEFSNYALAAFDIFYEPDDWDDWLTSERCAANYEPDDWDDWLVSDLAPEFENGIRRAYSSPDTDLQAVSKKIDPWNLYEPDDWDDWLTGGNYEPDDWDDWLVNSTIAEIAELH